MTVSRVGAGLIGARIHLTANKTVTESDTQQEIDWNGTAWQYGGMGVDLNANQLIAPRRGVYLWTGSGYFGGGAAGPRRLVIRRNYVNYDEVGVEAPAAKDIKVGGVIPMLLDRGDTITVDAYVGGTAGATSTVNLYGAQAFFTWVSLVLLSSGL